MQIYYRIKCIKVDPKFPVKQSIHLLIDFLLSFADHLPQNQLRGPGKYPEGGHLRRSGPSSLRVRSGRPGTDQGNEIALLRRND